MKKNTNKAIMTGVALAATAGAIYLYKTKKGAQARKKIEAMVDVKKKQIKSTVKKAKRIEKNIKGVVKTLEPKAKKATDKIRTKIAKKVAPKKKAVK